MEFVRSNRATTTRLVPMKWQLRRGIGWKMNLRQHFQKTRMALFDKTKMKVKFGVSARFWAFLCDHTISSSLIWVSRKQNNQTHFMTICNFRNKGCSRKGLSEELVRGKTPLSFFCQILGRNTPGLPLVKLDSKNGNGTACETLGLHHQMFVTQ